MCVLAKTEISHFVHIFIFIILIFHRHNSLQKQSLEVARLVKRISGHTCELLLTLFSNINSSNWAVHLFVQTPFDVAKQSVLGHALPSFAGAG